MEVKEKSTGFLKSLLRILSFGLYDPRADGGARSLKLVEEIEEELKSREKKKMKVERARTSVLEVLLKILTLGFYNPNTKYGADALERKEIIEK